jgi:outer membrane protein TolC
VRQAALANSTSLAQYRLKVEDGLLTKKTEYFVWLPSPSLSASAGATLWGDSAGGSVSLSAGLSQTVYDGGKYGVNREINAIALDLSRQDAQAAYFQALEEADDGYYGVLEATASLEAAQAGLESARLALSIAEIGYASGINNSSDLLQAQADAVDKEGAVNTARRNLLLAWTKLRSMTGLKELKELEPLEAGDALIGRLAALPLEDLEKTAGRFRTAAQKNPTLVKAALNVRQAESAVDLAKRDYIPTVSASLSLVNLGYKTGGDFSFSPMSISIGGKIPVDYWTIAAAVEKKRNAAAQSAIAYTAAEASLETELQTAILNIASLAGSVQTAVRALELRQRQHEQVFERFKLSHASVSELSDAANLLSAARSAYINALYKFYRQIASLRSLICAENEEEVINLLMQAN